jgi:hypothetical protein
MSFQQIKIEVLHQFFNLLVIDRGNFVISHIELLGNILNMTTH